MTPALISLYLVDPIRIVSRMADQPAFTLIEAHAIHQAFSDAMAEAREREERMPSSAEAFRARAENILRVRNKILATLPEHHRRNYPPFD